MTIAVGAYQHGIYPRSEDVVAATRGLERGRTTPDEVEAAYRDALMLDLTREILRPVCEGLAGRGYGLIHLEEPWLPYFGIDAADWGEFEKAVLELREATAGVTLVLHTYFADSGPHIDRLRK